MLPTTAAPGRAAAGPDPGPDDDQTPAPAAGLDTGYEQLRAAALHARAEAFTLGLGVLHRAGVIGWRHALAELTTTHTRPATARTPTANTPAPGVAAELVHALAGLALAGT